MNIKTVLITGGTGSFGNAVLNRFLNTDHFNEIRIDGFIVTILNFLLKQYFPY